MNSLDRLRYLANDERVAALKVATEMVADLAKITAVLESAPINDSDAGLFGESFGCGAVLDLNDAAARLIRHTQKCAAFMAAASWEQMAAANAARTGNVPA